MNFRARSESWRSSNDSGDCRRRGTMNRFLGLGVLALSMTLFARGVRAQSPVPPPPRLIAPAASPTAPARTSQAASVPSAVRGVPARTISAPSARVPASPPARPSAPAQAGRVSAAAGRSDASVRPAQVMPMQMATPPLGMPNVEAPAGADSLLGGQSISLQTALYGALMGNPALAGVRNNSTAPTPESVEVCAAVSHEPEPDFVDRLPADHADSP